MTDGKCPFCGSEERLVKTGKWEYQGMQLVEIEDFCCLSQKKNARYASTHRNRDGVRPDLDEVAKL